MQKNLKAKFPYVPTRSLGALSPTLIADFSSPSAGGVRVSWDRFMYLENEQRPDLTVADVTRYWLQNRRGEVKLNTWNCYRHAAALHINGPLLVGTKVQRQHFARYGQISRDAHFLPMLGNVPVRELTTAGIRSWHKLIASHVSWHSANVAKKYLRAALALAAEDLAISVPAMPTQFGRGRPRSKKAILTPHQVGLLLAAAVNDRDKGIYYSFPFLTGLRPSEQIALYWSDIDLACGVIRVQRIQEVDGSICDYTKTAASTRDVPISPFLNTLLEDWRQRCPNLDEKHPRVFPTLGRIGALRNPTLGRPLSYANFLSTYWRPALVTNNLPMVTPHSARHTFISTLQAQGIEVGLVAKLAGHADVAVTLAHYTQAVRGGEAAVRALEAAYSVRC